jgi:hypothetical protein
MNDTVETEIVKASAPVISAIVEKGMKSLMAEEYVRSLLRRHGSSRQRVRS